MVAPPAAALLILAMSMPAGSQQQAFTLRSDRIEIDKEQQWKAWQIPFGTVTVDERGVTANRVVGVHNASRDAFQFPIEADDKLGGAFAAFFGPIWFGMRYRHEGREHTLAAP